MRRRHCGQRLLDLTIGGKPPRLEPVEADAQGESHNRRHGPYHLCLITCVT
jgi:hypothetical protein